MTRLSDTETAALRGRIEALISEHKPDSEAALDKLSRFVLGAPTPDLTRADVALLLAIIMEFVHEQEKLDEHVKRAVGLGRTLSERIARELNRRTRGGGPTDNGVDDVFVHVPRPALESLLLECVAGIGGDAAPGDTAACPYCGHGPECHGKEGGCDSVTEAGHRCGCPARAP